MAEKSKSSLQDEDKGRSKTTLQKPEQDFMEDDSNKEFLIEELNPSSFSWGQPGTEDTNSKTSIVEEPAIQPAYLSSTSARRKTAEFCRICHEPSCSGRESYISPCDCRGSLTLVHQSCLERWLAEADSSRCELCGHQFRVRRKPKLGVLRSVLSWLLGRQTWRERRLLALDLLAFILMCPVIGAVNFGGLQLTNLLHGKDLTAPSPLLHREDDTNNIFIISSQLGIITMLLTLDFAFITWFTLRLHHHATKWYSWYRRNCDVTLIGYPKVDVAKNSSDQTSVSSISNIRTIEF